MSLPSPATATYLSIGGVDIRLDIYSPIGAEGSLPVVIYFHGGGLVSGARRDILFPTWTDEILKRNVIFICPDYRLLFPCTAFNQIDDVKALFSFVTDREAMKPQLSPNVTVDANRIAVAGMSAGAYMARLAALYGEPKPKAVWSLYGNGGDWFLDHWLQKSDEGFAFFGGATLRSEVAALVDGTTPVDACAPVSIIGGNFNDKLNRLKLCSWLYQEGAYVEAISGVPGLADTLRALPHGERAAAVPKEVAIVFPQLMLTPEFPPTLLTHGAEDSVVPLAESEETFKQLQALGVESKLTVIAAEHCLFVAGVPAIPSVLAAGAAAAIEEGVDFLAKHLA